MNAHHHLVILEHWLGDVLEREDALGRAVRAAGQLPASSQSPVPKRYRPGCGRESQSGSWEPPGWRHADLGAAIPQAPVRW